MMRHLLACASGAALLALSVSAAALPATIHQAADTAVGTCDTLDSATLLGGGIVELGNVDGPFTAGVDSIASAPGAMVPNMPSCGLALPTDIFEVSITNTTSTDFSQVWYVGDATDTTITNSDGTVNNGLAFLIDSVGGNASLLSESILADGIFQAGETWMFFLATYLNTGGINPAAFGSDGVGDQSSGVGSFESSGSIIALPVPEPGTALLLGLGLAGLARAGRKA